MNDVKVLPVHPKTSSTFKEWFKEFSNLIAMINLHDPFSSSFEKVAYGFAALSAEISYEIGSRVDRTVGSVYDRPDYVVRELLRTNRVINLTYYLKTVCSALATEKAEILPTSAIKYGNSELDIGVSIIILREIPSAYALLFTAVETIGTINIDDLLRILRDILIYARKNVNTNVILSSTQYDIFTGIISSVKSCLDNLKALNTSLFFTLFQDFELMELLVECVIKAHVAGRLFLVGWASQCMNVYIEASQSKPDLKKNAENPEFVAKYKEMIDTVVNPMIKESREHRAKFRSILHYSRSLK
jgi:hypothetical protein